jgi:hypothetical protein
VMFQSWAVAANGGRSLSVRGLGLPVEEIDYEADPADDRSTSLPAWLLKKLEGAGVSDEIMETLDEESARDLVADIRSDAAE